MPIAYKCSRCGSYYDNNRHAYEHRPDMPYRLCQTSEIFDDCRVDLCPACHERFNSIVNAWLEPEQVMMKCIVDRPEEGKKKRWWQK